MYSNTWFEISHLWKVEKGVGRKTLVFYIIQINKFYLDKWQNRDLVFRTFNLCFLEQKSYFVSVLVCILFQGQNYLQEWKVKPASEKFLGYLLFCDLYDIRRYIYRYRERERHRLLFSLSVMYNFLWPYGLQQARFPCSSPSPEVAQIHVHWVSDAVQLFHPLPSPSSPSIFPSIRVFSNGLVLHIRWPEYWNFSFIITPFSEYSGLIFFRIDWFSLYHWKAYIIQCSAFLMVQLSHTYTTIGKTIALTRWTFVGKVMSLLFNMLSRFVIAFLPRRSVF